MDRLSTIHFFFLFVETTVRRIRFVETLPFRDGYGKELSISSLSQTRLPYEMPFEEGVAESVYCLKWRWILARGDGPVKLLAQFWHSRVQNTTDRSSSKVGKCFRMNEAIHVGA